MRRYLLLIKQKGSLFLVNKQLKFFLLNQKALGFALLLYMRKMHKPMVFFSSRGIASLKFIRLLRVVFSSQQRRSEVIGWNSGYGRYCGKIYVARRQLINWLAGASLFKNVLILWIASCLIFLFSVKRKQLFVTKKITILPKDNLRGKIIITAASEVLVQKFCF